MGKQGERAHCLLADAYLTSDYSHMSPTPLVDGAYCNALLLAQWSVRQKLNHVSSVQLRCFILYFGHAYSSFSVYCRAGFYEGCNVYYIVILCWCCRNNGVCDSQASNYSRSSNCCAVYSQLVDDV